MIRPIDPAERVTARRIVRIQRAAYAVEAQLMGFDGIPPLHETEQQVAASGHLAWLGAFVRRTLVGVLAWERIREVVEIDRLAIDPTFSRQGHGRRLVQAVPMSAVTVVSTGTANMPALTLYSSLGFREIGRTEIAAGIFTTQLERRLAN